MSLDEEALWHVGVFPTFLLFGLNMPHAGTLSLPLPSEEDYRQTN